MCTRHFLYILLHLIMWIITKKKKKKSFRNRLLRSHLGFLQHCPCGLPCQIIDGSWGKDGPSMAPRVEMESGFRLGLRRQERRIWETAGELAMCATVAKVAIWPVGGSTRAGLGRRRWQKGGRTTWVGGWRDPDDPLRDPNDPSRHDMGISWQAFAWPIGDESQELLLQRQVWEGRGEIFNGEDGCFEILLKCFVN